MAAQLAEAHLIKDWNRLDLAAPVVMGQGWIAEISDICGKLSGDG